MDGIYFTGNLFWLWQACELSCRWDLICLSMVIVNWSTQKLHAGIRPYRPIIPRYIDCDLVHPGYFVKRDVILLLLQHCSLCTEYKANKVELLDGSWSLMWLLWRQSGTEDSSLRKSRALFFPRRYFPRL